MAHRRLRVETGAGVRRRHDRHPRQRRSDEPTSEAAYAFKRLPTDVIDIRRCCPAPGTSGCGASRYGANVGRYLASRSDRVAAMVYIGIVSARPSTIRSWPTSTSCHSGRMAVRPDRLSAGRARRHEVSDLVGGSARRSSRDALKSAEAYKSRLGGTPVTLEVDGRTRVARRRSIADGCACSRSRPSSRENEAR